MNVVDGIDTPLALSASLSCCRKSGNPGAKIFRQVFRFLLFSDLGRKGKHYSEIKYKALYEKQKNKI